MKLYLSAVIENKVICEAEGGLTKFLDFKNLHILESFYSFSQGDEFYFDKCADLLIDSGAFSVMNSKGQKDKFDCLAYVKRYAEFINKYNIQNFIELDIDGVYGAGIYKDCLHYLQDKTGRDPIRVFHLWRGLDYYIELVKRQPRICIGGVAIKYIEEADYDIFNPLLEIAHNNNCKVHCLGIGSVKNLRKYDFDSTDSATWLASVRYGYLYRFNGHELCRYMGSENCTDDERIDRTFVGKQALLEWAKFSNYLDTF